MGRDDLTRWGNCMFSASEQLRGKKILLVDDDAELARMMRLRFWMADLNCMTATHPLEAKKLIHDHKIDIVLTDHDMPHQTGIQMVQDLRSGELHKPDLIYLFSGKFSPDNLPAELGIRCCFPKPLDFDRFFHIIENDVRLPTDVELDSEMLFGL